MGEQHNPSLASALPQWKVLLTWFSQPRDNRLGAKQHWGHQAPLAHTQDVLQPGCSEPVLGRFDCCTPARYGLSECGGAEIKNTMERRNSSSERLPQEESLVAVLSCLIMSGCAGFREKRREKQYSEQREDKY